MSKSQSYESLEGNLTCCICLELFRNPLTIPCGHTFCQICIHEHWDARELRQEEITCPECRIIYQRRPEPQKNVCLHKVLEGLKETEQKKVLAKPKPTESEPKVARTVCQEHKHKITFYCLTEKRCICKKCMLKSCRNHNFEDLEEQSEKERTKLSTDFEANGRKKENIEKEIDEWRDKSKNIKDFHDKLVSTAIAKFDQVRKTLEECQTLVVKSVRCKENTELGHVSNHLQLLQQHLQDINKYHTEAERLLDTGISDAEFLQGLPLLIPVGCAPIPPDFQCCGTEQIDAVTRVLPEVTRLLQEELPNALYPVAAQPGDTPKKFSSFEITEPCCTTQTSRSIPIKISKEINPNSTTMSTHRAKLYEDYRNLMFDPETAHRYIEISPEHCKATHKKISKYNNVPESPKRFQSWHVMCMEGFSKGSHYWEVEVSTFFAQIGVAYGSINRTKEMKIGRNCQSWSLELRSMSQSVWHNDKEIVLKKIEHRRIGVHLDCGDGSITFFSINNGGLEHLHSFQSVFLEKLYPVFWIGEDVSVKLHHVQNNPGGNAAV